MRGLGKDPRDMLGELKKSLKGQALEHVKNLLALSDENFQVACELLNDFYANTQGLVRSLINELIDMAPLKSNATNDLTAFYSAVTAMRQRFSQLAISDEDLATLFFVISIERKLPPEINRTWSKKVMQYEEMNAQPDRFVQLPLQSFFSHVLLEIKQRSVQASRTNVKKEQAPKPKPSRKGPGQIGKVDGLIFTTVKAGSKPLPCNLCDDMRNHDLETCETVKKMTLSDRWDRIRARQLCAGCQEPLFGLGHEKGQCHVRCNKGGCTMKHHSFLHYVPKQAQNANKGTGGQKRPPRGGNPGNKDKGGSRPVQRSFVTGADQTVNDGQDGPQQ